MAARAGRRIPRRMDASGISTPRAWWRTTAPATGCITTGSTPSWPRSGAFSEPQGGKMEIEVKGRHVVVCGGSRGIGRSIALGFAAAGASVSICARGAAALEATRAELAAFGSTAHAASCDLGSEAAIRAYIPAAAAALGGIDVLVNNATGY